ncbi:MAG: hypothetical protein A3I05_04015 [Deltaproteobacteria bacterium RIFCSPLOWO2_02_FULL_44_10]|nr:MAG: hypothetical protein A3C46_03830 [Deltaproteobacteria bacterium RIFCSPHIGHO2_02_FULL_44_16]OGQ46314.1 MAG: hypothetical protein A3I05_04015 [Deltaproteobacteria bacterium RIFCSPLOWO2_02_FULL_44_10]
MTHSTPLFLRRIGIFAGPLLALFFYFFLLSSTTLSHAGLLTASIAILMALWWMTEAIPIAATALLPLLLFPLFGVLDAKETSSPYAHRLIFLFLGGFLLAASMQRCNLHRRLALIVLKMVGDRPIWLIGGFMFVTASISLFVSNTATVMMLLPIAISIAKHLEEKLSHEERQQFSTCLMLGLAYSASIGGVGSLIGTPPNALFAAFLQNEFGITISFREWLKFGLPIVLLFLPLTWLLLTKIIFPVHTKHLPQACEIFEQELTLLGKVSRAEWFVMIIFTLTALGWMFSPLLSKMFSIKLDDTSIAIAASLLLFLIPGDKEGDRLLTWNDTTSIPWGVLILFGGGLSLAHALSVHGVTDVIGKELFVLKDAHPFVLVLSVTTIVVFLSEITSNTAIAATFLPVLGAIAKGIGIDPFLFLFPATIGISYAFMMPVGTPPNALIFSSERVSMSHMIKAGFLLNLISIIFISLYSYFIVPLLRIVF